MQGVRYFVEGPADTISTGDEGVLEATKDVVKFILNRKTE